MMAKKLDYEALLVACRGAFQQAIKSMGFNENEAFGYTYDHMEILLRDPSSWIRIATYAVLFKCASEYSVPLLSFKKDDPFTSDLRSELLEVFASFDRLFAIEEVPTEFRDLIADLSAIRKEYENWAST